MTILQALAARYGRLAAKGRLPELGFAPAQIAFTLVLRPDGSLAAVNDERSIEGKKPRPRVVEAPTPPKRTVAVTSGTLWDKTSYVLGRTRIDEPLSATQIQRATDRCAQEYRAFRRRHEALLADIDDDGARALLRFLREWTPTRYDDLTQADAMLDQNVAFRLEGDRAFLHDRPAIRAALRDQLAEEGDAETGICLVTGRKAAIARLHPSIKGVPGGQSSGCSLVSFNLDAFNSYGKSQGLNAPVSEAVAFAYATALNDLLAATNGTDERGHPRWRHRVRLGRDTVVFWAEAPEAEDLVGECFTPTDDTELKAVRDVLHQLQAGRPLRDTALGIHEKSRVYVLGLSPNVARLSVRFWHQTTLDELTRQFIEHWRDLALEPSPLRRPPAMWALLHELAPQRKAENVPAHLAGELTRAILSGGRYPSSLLAQTVMRIRADQDRKDPKTNRTLEKISFLRVAMLKACLARDFRKQLIAEDVPVALDLEDTNKGYRLGRLFAVMEGAQAAALPGIGATIRDRFYGAASATPGHVFPILVRGVQDHLSKLRKDKPGLAVTYEKAMTDVMVGLMSRSFPATLDLHDQGRFAIGYYHQRAALYGSKKAATDENEENDTATADDQG